MGNLSNGVLMLSTCNYCEKITQPYTHMIVLCSSKRFLLYYYSIYVIQKETFLLNVLLCQCINTESCTKLYTIIQHLDIVFFLMFYNRNWSFISNSQNTTILRLFHCVLYVQFANMFNILFCMNALSNFLQFKLLKYVC